MPLKPLVIVDGCAVAAPPFNRGTIYNAVGSGNNVYWARWNENPAVGSETSLITVFPANSGPGNVGAESRVLGLLHYNDNEDSISQSVNPAEVDVLDWGPELTVNGLTGETRITVAAPMFGFSYTIVGTFADLYPVVRERANYLWLNHLPATGNLPITPPHPASWVPGFSEVLQISSE